MISDEFGGNGFLSRLNRGYTGLLKRIFSLPETWTENPGAMLRHHLDRLNQISLTVLFFAGIAASIVVMVIAIANDASLPFLIGISIIPGIFLVQYILALFCSANLRLTFGSPIFLVSRLIPQTYTILGAIQALALAVGGVVVLTMVFPDSLGNGLTLLILILWAVVVSAFIPWISANSEPFLNVHYRDTIDQGPADYFFNLVRYSARFYLAQVPLYFAVSSLALLFGSIYAAVVLGVASKSDESGMGFALIFLIPTILAWLPTILGIALLPITAHFFFLFVSAIADMGSAFFRLVESSQKIADLSDQAMNEGSESGKK